jgi:hypothetical protein
MYDDEAVEWGDTDSFSLRVSQPSFAYGDTAEFRLTNTTDRRLDIGTTEKFQIELYTADGWQDLRGQTDGERFSYTQMGLTVPPDDGPNWSRRLTETDLSGTADDREQTLRVCPDLQSGRYRFLFRGTPSPVAVAFDLSR